MISVRSQDMSFHLEPIVFIPAIFILSPIVRLGIISGYIVLLLYRSHYSQVIKKDLMVMLVREL